jgi:Ca2+-binding RTX toxin-like protein
VSGNRLPAGLLALFALVALTWPSGSLADHISISAGVSAGLKERLSEDSWIVEVNWSASCNGAGGGGASYTGNLYLVDSDTGERIYLGGVFSASGKVDQVIHVKATEQRFTPELHISCFENATLHGSDSVTVQGAAAIVPARNDNGEHGHGGGGSSSGGGGGGGSGGNDPTAPLANGGCKLALQGTEGPDNLVGGGGGDVIFGYGGSDRLRGASGHDCLLGGSGNDTLQGESGNDRLTGGSGRDLLVGGPGTNSYDAGSGNDVVNAVNGRRELVRCGPGSDRARVDRRDRTSGCERLTRVG